MDHDLRNICLTAHVDAGKTSLAEQILFQSGAVRKMGRVDDGSSYFDASPIEIERGITIFSEISALYWKNCKINMIDTPGHIDFIAELESALGVVEGVVIILSAVEGIQQQTELIWELVCAKRIPALFFINKADRPEADITKVYNQIVKSLTKNAVMLSDPIWFDQTIQWDQKPIFNEEQVEERNRLIEILAEKDSCILTKYLEEEPISASELLVSLQDQFKSNQLFPVLAGSAKTGIGINSLLDRIVDLVPPPSEKIRAEANDQDTHQNVHQDNDDKSRRQVARIFKIKNEETDKLAYVKVLAGQINVRDTIHNAQNEECKVTKIRTFLGNRCTFLDNLQVGDIGIISGLKNITVGEVLGNTTIKPEQRMMKRSLQAQVFPDDEADWAKLHGALLILNEEDPSLEYEWEPQSKEMVIHIMGKIHIEIIEALLETRFKLHAHLSSPIVKYFETVTKISRGFCHFEPKKHYAEVEVVLEPNERGEGNRFVSLVSTDELPISYQKAIEKSIPEALVFGTLTGSPLIDVTVTLVAGKHHLEHTHGGDFRIATIRAIRQALENNRILLLEPITEFKITVSSDLSGKVMSDIARMKGTAHDPVIEKDVLILTGHIPLATSMDYPLDLTSFSAGKAQMMMKPSGLQPCHNQEQVLAELNDVQVNSSDAHHDMLYNAVSLFRAKRKMKKVIFEKSFDLQE